ncbi:TerC family protein [Cytobacillus purgationiresistens]|uniref:YkoY family integral membrane protein n=1 Tax=Cytobacillus purgationiresistens TaxID=863449 RepID=A0ABU0AL84_9BACI|nr:TerC family protein [Cytobacillus purgationiresistens]MDQ0272020.1 YkoY family integral membrane protein [Cytobacillus purgationiresistens]
MAIIDGILHTYAQFFNWEMWVEALSRPESWALIGTLVILEGLLSADNALVLAVMVKHLPPQQRKKALFYGLLGAYFFRFLAIGVGVYLIEFWWIKVLGAGYLAWLAIKYFIDKKRAEEAGDEEELKGINQRGLLIRLFGTFWGTVIAVELMDIAFSIDSILAALGVSQEIWVLLVGGMLGIIMMRGVAGVFLRLIDRVPELETSSYILILLIALKMLLSAAGIHIDHIYFFFVLIIVFAITFIVHARNKKKEATG